MLEFNFTNNWIHQSRELFYFDMFTFNYNPKSWLNASSKLSIVILNFEFEWCFR